MQITPQSFARLHRASGFYANHHGGGLDFVHNTAVRNAINFNLLNVLADNRTDVPGYDHRLINNLGFAPRSAELANFDPAASAAGHNSFTLPVTVTADDFVSAPVEPGPLLRKIAAPRAADGSLPDRGLFRLAAGSDLIDRGQPLAEFAFDGAAPDLGCFERTGDSDSASSRR